MPRHKSTDVPRPQNSTIHNKQQPHLAGPEYRRSRPSARRTSRNSLPDRFSAQVSSRQVLGTARLDCFSAFCSTVCISLQSLTLCAARARRCGEDPAKLAPGLANPTAGLRLALCLPLTSGRTVLPNSYVTVTFPWSSVPSESYSRLLGRGRGPRPRWRTLGSKKSPAESHERSEWHWRALGAGSRRRWPVASQVEIYPK